MVVPIDNARVNQPSQMSTMVAPINDVRVGESTFTMFTMVAPTDDVRVGESAFTMSTMVAPRNKSG